MIQNNDKSQDSPGISFDVIISFSSLSFVFDTNKQMESYPSDFNRFVLSSRYMAETLGIARQIIFSMIMSEIVQGGTTCKIEIPKPGSKPFRPLPVGAVTILAAELQQRFGECIIDLETGKPLDPTLTTKINWKVDIGSMLWV